MEQTTVEQQVQGVVYIWAVPDWDYVDGERVYNGKWDYQLSTSSKIYTTGAVRIYARDVSLTMPGGVDLVTAAVETLQSEKEAARKEWLDREHAIDMSIQRLLQLTHQPEGEHKEE